MDLVSTISGILTNIFSSFMYDKIGVWREKKKLEKFHEDLIDWIRIFRDNNDGTIVTSNNFCMFIKNNKVIESIIEYVTKIYLEDKSESKFVESILKDLKEYFREDEANPMDCSIAKDLFTQILEKTRYFTLSQIDENHKGLMYLIFQTKYEVDEVMKILRDQKGICFSNPDLVKSFANKVRGNECGISIYNITYYKAWIKEYQDKKMILYVNKKVMADYDNIFCDISKCLEYSWKTELINSVEIAIKTIDIGCDDYKRLKEGIEIINQCVDYTISFNIFNNIITESKMPKITYENIKEKLYRRFNKVVIISGEPRSGKTHFLKNYISYTLLNKKANFIIPVEYYELLDIDLQGMEDLCLDKINECFNSDYKNLNDVYIKEDLKEEKLQIILIIDDIQKLFIDNPNSFYKVMECMQKMSKYDYLKWIISVNEFDTYIFDDGRNGSYLDKYCIDFKHLYMEKDTMFNYTVNLTFFNNKFSIGKKILELYGVRLYDTEKFEMNTIGTYNLINNPLYAHILGINSNGEEVIPYVATYLKFITEIVELIDKKLKDFENVAYTSINKAVVDIVDLVFKNKKIIFFESEILEKCKREIINILWKYNLLRRSEEKNHSVLSLRYLESNYELYTKIYWVLKMVLVQRERENNNYLKIYNNLNSIEKYKDELISCYLLYLDHIEDKSYYDLFSIFLKDHNVNYALFSSPKASLDFKKNLYKIIINTTNNSLNKVETFSLLYYLYYYNAKNNEKFAVINKYAKCILDSDLFYNLKLVMDSILNNVKSIGNFKHDICELFSIEVGEINSILGYECGQKFYDLCEKQDLDRQINNIWMYLNSNKERIGNSTGTTFMDWFLRTYLNRIIHEFGVVEIFNRLSKKRFFTFDGEEQKLGLFFRRNFVCAAGNIYSGNPNVEYKQRYIEIVNLLMEKEFSDTNEKVNSYIFAYHFMSNSIKGESGDKEIVDQVFVKYLKKIYNYEALREFSRNRAEFIWRNINYWNNINETSIK